MPYVDKSVSGETAKLTVEAVVHKERHLVSADRRPLFHAAGCRSDAFVEKISLTRRAVVGFRWKSVEAARHYARVVRLRRRIRVPDAAMAFGNGPH